MIRRINLFGGPGSGKSTTAAELFARLKRDGHKIELVREYVKNWAYENRPVTGFDQLYLFAKQLRMEDILLRNGVELIVTDSPISLSTCYAERYGHKGMDGLRLIAKDFEYHYPSLNIFLDRGKKEYVNLGRYETEEQAKEMDVLIYKHLVDNNITVTRLPFLSFESVYDYVVSQL
jgi:nicotinamide riboside kinase